jgi:hypothetical protein
MCTLWKVLLNVVLRVIWIVKNRRLVWEQWSGWMEDGEYIRR